MGRYKVSKVLDKFYSDRSYLILKIAPMLGSYEDEFESGDIVNISKVKENR